MRGHKQREDQSLDFCGMQLHARYAWAAIRNSKGRTLVATQRVLWGQVLSAADLITVSDAYVLLVGEFGAQTRHCHPLASMTSQFGTAQSDSARQANVVRWIRLLADRARGFASRSIDWFCFVA